MSTTVSNPYSFNIVNNISFNTSIVSDSTIIGNATFSHNGSSPNRYLSIGTESYSFGDGWSMSTSGSFNQINNTKFNLITFIIDETNTILGPVSVIFIKSSSNITGYAAYIEIDDCYRIGVYLGYALGNNRYSNANGSHYYQSNIWKKNSSTSFSTTSSADVINYIASKNYICNLVSWIENLN